jgi:hypothetical protein
LARFQGNIHASSDRAGATVLFVILLIIVLLAGWYLIDPVGFAQATNNIGITMPVPAR